MKKLWRRFVKWFEEPYKESYISIFGNDTKNENDQDLDTIIAANAVVNAASVACMGI